jgi:tetratricopeptide (TPR) repeat protein
MEDLRIRELYAVEYSLYTEESIGTVTVYNSTDSELRGIIILDGDQYINSPMRMTANLPPKQKTEVPLYLDLDVSVLDLGRKVERIPVSVEMSVYLGTAKIGSDKVETDITLHDRRKIPEGDPEKIAMFIDPGDKFLVSEISAGMGKTNDEKAAAAFQLLQKKGIYCVGVGNTQIQYPRELLRTKFGSFYDCSFLYSAILELLGVETKLMFNSKVMLTLYKNDSEWHPVDINMLSLDFQAARASGGKLRYSVSSQSSYTVVLREAWRKYPPLKFPELAPNDMSQLQLVDEYIEDKRFEDAAKIYQELLEKYPKQPVLLNNSGNIDLLMGKMQRALTKYTQAAERSPDDSGVYLNMGIAYYKMGDEEKGIEYLGRAYTKLGSYTAMCQMLNLDEESVFYEEVDQILRKAVHRTTEVYSTALGVRSLKKSQYPLYWKRFQ